MKKSVCVFMLTLLVGFFSFSNLSVMAQGGEDGKAMQEKMQKAVSGLKKEVRSKVEVANGGIITGNVKCRRVRTPENVVVYIEKVNDNKFTAPTEHGAIDQLNLTFVPHVMAVQRGTTIDFPNSDLVRHNVFSPPGCCKQFNLGTYDVGTVKSVTFDKSGEVPLLCNVHAEMSAFLVVLDNPYFSVTGKGGAFKIEDVPPGKYKLTTWHEKLRAVTKDVTVEAGKTVNVNFELKKRK